MINVAKKKSINDINFTYLEGGIRVFLCGQSHVETRARPGVTRMLFLLTEARSLVQNLQNVAPKLQ